MSLPEFAESGITREEAINQILSSIAMEELGLSHIINAEGEKLQYALGTISGDSPGLSEPPTLDDLLKLNESVRATLDSVAQNQMFLKAKMEKALSPSAGQETPCPFLSSYMEGLGNGQTVGTQEDFVFDVDSVDSVGNNITIDPDGKTFTINRTGLYHIEWDVNLAAGSTSAVIGIVENGEGASGTSSTTGGNLSSGTLINVDTVPFTISLRNYGDSISVENHAQFENTAASIRIVRFADGPSKT